MNSNSSTSRSIGDRIRRWRKGVPLKCVELSRMLKISQGSLSEIENNKSLPSADTIIKLHKSTNLNILWVLTGKGPMTKEGLSLTKAITLDSKNNKMSLAVEPELETLLVKIIQIFRSNDDQKKLLIKRIVESI